MVPKKLIVKKIKNLILNAIGITQTDKKIASWLRRSYGGILKNRVLLVVNKVDNNERAEMVKIFERLGLGEPVSCSAVHSAGM